MLNLCRFALAGAALFVAGAFLFRAAGAVALSLMGVMETAWWGLGVSPALGGLIDAACGSIIAIAVFWAFDKTRFARTPDAATQFAAKLAAGKAAALAQDASAQAVRPKAEAAFVAGQSLAHAA